MMVACVLRSGGDFNAEYVRRLKSGVDAHLSGHEFVCLSDVAVPCQRIPLKTDWPGWWAKLELFGLPGPVLYFDLDTVITGDLSEIAAYPHRFTMLRGFSHPDSPASGVMAWHGDYSYLRDAFDPERDYPGHGDQGYIGHMLRHEPDLFQDLFPGRIVSRKQPATRSADERVVCFHGKPRPHQVGWNIACRRKVSPSSPGGSLSMQFKYIGDNAETTVFGIEFKQGQATHVTDELAIRKLSTNPHFQEVTDDKQSRSGKKGAAKAGGVRSKRGPKSGGSNDGS